MQIYVKKKRMYYYFAWGLIVYDLVEFVFLDLLFSIGRVGNQKMYN